MSQNVRDVRLDFSDMMNDSGHLDPIVHDLLSLVRRAYLLDRSEPRGASPDDVRWHRVLRLPVPVLSPSIWSQPGVTQAVEELLEWLTDDHWIVRWEAAAGAPTALAGQTRVSLDEVRDVILFSGGLDAVAGVALLLPTRNLEAVAISTNPRMQAYQTRTIGALREARLGSLGARQVRFAVSNGKRDAEPTRRTRGLVFLAVGTAVARRNGRRSIIMAENGIGAINLPLTGAQRGAMTSRSAHPRTLLLYSRLIERVTGEPFTVETPLLRLTKAEAVSRLPVEARASCQVSESCDHAAAGRGRLQGRCGYCSSCLLRRMAFRAARREGWDHAQYLADTEDEADRSQEPEMLWQAAKLDRALRSPDGGELRRRFPDLEYVPSGALDQPALRRLLTQYVDEWRAQRGERIRRFLSAMPVAGGAGHG